MKMFKKIMAVALTAVMALSMLTGCAVTDKFVADAVKTALTNATNAQGVKVTFTESTKSEDKDAAKAGRKVIADFAKDANNKKTAPTQDLLTELNNNEDKYAYVLVKYSTSTSEVQKSLDQDVKTYLAAMFDDGDKVKFTVSDSVEAAKENGKSDKMKYAVVVLYEAN